MNRAWILAMAAIIVAACSRDSGKGAAALTGGDPKRGEAAIRSYGCGTCHQIPGVPGATGNVGPSLEHIAVRSYLHGKESNTPETLTRWIQHPQQREPGNAMPDMHVNDADARDIAAYLYTLR